MIRLRRGWRNTINLGGAATLLLLACGYVILRYTSGREVWTLLTILVVAVLCGVSLVFGYFGWRKSDAANGKLQLGFVGALAGIAVAEIAGQAHDGWQRRRAPEASVVARQLVQFIIDKRRAGEHVYGYFNPVYFDQEALTPIGGVKNVYCDEGSGHDVFETDRYGFRNPPHLVSAAEFRPGTVILGDSFAVGCGVKDGETAADVLRQHFDPTTYNASVGGTGPLQQYAILREYVARLKPKVILWFFFEGNDLANLDVHEKRPFLQFYLQTDDIRHLADAHDRIRERLIRWHDQSLHDAARPLRPPLDPAPAGVPGLWPMVTRVLMRSILVERITSVLHFTTRPTSALIDRYVEILNRAQRLVDGTIHIVYVPELARYTEWFNFDVQSYRDAKAALIQALVANRYPVIDLDEGFRRTPGGPRSLYPSGRGTDVHLNAAGNKLAGELIIRTLRTSATAGAAGR